jgi:hypothetical protein
MNALFFLTVSSLGICALIALYTHLVGFSRRALLTDENAARGLVNKLQPGKTITHLMLADDGHTTLAIFDDGSGSLLHAMGHKWVAHVLTEQSIRQMVTIKSGDLQLAFNDFTAPGIRISLGGAAEGEAWQAALRPFLKAPKTTVKQAA